MEKNQIETPYILPPISSNQHICSSTGLGTVVSQARGTGFKYIVGHLPSFPCYRFVFMFPFLSGLLPRAHSHAQTHNTHTHASTHEHSSITTAHTYTHHTTHAHTHTHTPHTHTHTHTPTRIRTYTLSPALPQPPLRKLKIHQ